MKADLEIIRRYCSRLDAEHAKSILQAYEIASSFDNIDSSGWTPLRAEMYCTFSIVVRKEDAETAKAILDELMGS